MNEFKNKKILITGGAGFIGINLVEKLLSLESEITVVDLPSANFSALPPGISVIKSDIKEMDSYRNAIMEAEFVFHLAAKTDLSGKTINDYMDNYEGTRILLSTLKNNRKLKRFVYYSTQLTVGIFNETRFIDEHEPYKTKTLYGKSKILGEEIVLEECTQSKIPFVIIRPTSVYGPYGKEPYRDYFLKIKEGKYFNIGKADNLVSMCFVKNLIEQTLFLAAHELSQNKIFFGNDFHPYTMREFSEAAADYLGVKILTLPDILVYPAAYGLGVLKLLGIRVPLYPFRLRNIKASYCYDIGNSVQLGYYPPFDLKDGIEETLKWYLNHDADFNK